MVYFIDVRPIFQPFGIFYVHLVYFMSIWCIYSTWYNLCSFGVFYVRLVDFWSFWHIFPRLGLLYQEKSGNPARMHDKGS
jgi:hypothetical protein